MKFFSLLHIFPRVPEISSELVHKHHWWFSSSQQSSKTLFSNVENTLIALQILINVAVVSYKMLHYSLFPPLCKFCIRKWIRKKNTWKRIKMKKTGILKKVLPSMCTVKTELSTQSSNESHTVSAEPSTWICTTNTTRICSALPLVSEHKLILSWKILVVLRNTDMQGDASAEQGAPPWILLQPLKNKNKKLHHNNNNKKEKNFVLCFTVAASKLTMQPKGLLSCQDHSRFLGWSSQSCFAARCIWQLRVVQQRQAVLRHHAPWWKALSCAATELQNGDT